MQDSTVCAVWRAEKSMEKHKARPSVLTVFSHTHTLTHLFCTPLSPD